MRPAARAVAPVADEDRSQVPAGVQNLHDPIAGTARQAGVGHQAQPGEQPDAGEEQERSGGPRERQGAAEAHDTAEDGL